MAKFVVLAGFTDQGIRNVKETVSRAEAFKEMAKKSGVIVFYSPLKRTFVSASGTSAMCHKRTSGLQTPVRRFFNLGDVPLSCFRESCPSAHPLRLHTMHCRS
jgi:hypothetical protein